MGACSLIRMLIVIGLSTIGQAPGTVRFSRGFPVAVPGTGCALVMGTARASPDFELRAANVQYWIGGGGVNTATTNIGPDGSFGAVIYGLKPGTTYNVMVNIVEIQGDKKETLANISRFVAR